MAYRFRLQKLLEWRQSQLDAARSDLERAVAVLEQSRLALVRLDMSRQEADRRVMGAASLDGAELHALERYRLKIRQKALEAKQHIAAGEQRVCEEKQHVVDAHRQVRLLEKLNERRYAEWRIAEQRDTERTDSEAFLARWQPPS